VCCIVLRQYIVKKKPKNCTKVHQAVGSMGPELTLVNHIYQVLGPGLTLVPRRTGVGPGSGQQ
jgi:hypothetical protein